MTNPTENLTAAQKKNLDLLNREGALCVRSKSTRRRTRANRYMADVGTLSGTHRKADRKGYHTTALDSLADKGMIERSVVTEQSDNWAYDLTDPKARQPTGAWITEVITYSPK